MSETLEEYQARFVAAIREKGHFVALNEEGKPDFWVCEYDHHNGPGCETCGESWCEHCVGPEAVGPCPRPVLELTCVEVVPPSRRLA